ncbi:MAG: response regulator [Deltaproteobacteria bacterium]|nr:response regulator [Deltaproteobacteria bacterium]
MKHTPSWKTLIISYSTKNDPALIQNLESISFQDKRVETISVHSNKEAKQKLMAHPSIALILFIKYNPKNKTLTLELIKHVHETLNNKGVRFMIQGEKSFNDFYHKDFEEYDIHQYLTPQKLIVDELKPIVFSALCSYQTISHALQNSFFTEQERTFFLEGPIVVFKWENKENYPLIYVSANTEKILGYTPDEFLHSKVSFLKQVVYPGDLHEYKTRYKDFRKKNQDFLEQEFRLVCKNGKIILASSITTPIRDHNWEITHYLCYLFDNTYFKETELLLFEKEIDGIMFIGEDFHVKKLNQAMSEMLLNTKQEVVGGFLFDYFSPDQQHRLEESFKTAVTQKQSIRLEINLLKKNQLEIPCQVTISPTHSFYERNKGFFIFFVDLSDRKQIEEELRTAIQAEKRFIASVSHEIRTPLSSILGYSELLNDTTSLNEQQKKYSKNIANNSQHLLNLINDILDISKIEANQLRLNEQETAISELLSECAVMISSKIKDKVKLKVSIPEFNYYFLCDPIRIKQIFINLLSNAAKFTDEGQIHLYLKDYQELPNNHVLLWICVEDSGIGIHESKQKELYQPFKQAHAGEYGGTGLGLYLSRSIAKIMNGDITLESKVNQGSVFTVRLELNKGNFKDVGFHFKNIQILTIEDEPNLTDLQIDQIRNTGAKIYQKKGTQDLSGILKEIIEIEQLEVAILDLDALKDKAHFVIGYLKELFRDIIVFGIKSQSNRLQIEELDCLLTKPFLFHIFGKELNNFISVIQEKEYDFTKLKVLLAEDIKANQLLFQQMFYKFFKIQPDIANNGKEAVDMLKITPYDVIFMDVMMPVMDGIKATEEIRKFNKTVPIVAVTGNVFAEDIEKTKKAGMNDFLSKPIQKNDLHRVLLSSLNKGGLSHHISQPQQEEPKTPETPKGSSGNLKDKIMDYIMELSGDKNVAEEIYQTTLSEIQGIIGEVKLGFDSEDHTSLASSLHKLKGLFMNTGLNPQGKMIQEIEQKLKDKGNVDPLINYQTDFFKELEEFV